MNAPLYDLPSVCSMLGIKTTKAYQLLGNNDLKAVKIGRRTLVTDESLRSYIAALPPADIRTGRKAVEA